MKTDIVRVLSISIFASILFYLGCQNQIKSNLDAIIQLSGSLCFLCLPTLVILKKNIKEMI